jgi:exodeoxyribonuclease III
MRLATWNVNSLNVRLPHLIAWLERERPDVVCLQETKLEDARFPVAPLREAGYEVLASGQKSYNGVAILTRTPPAEAANGMPGWVDEQKRVLTATVSGMRLVCLYAPNGERLGTTKFEYKMRWFEALRTWLREELARHPRLAVAGDFNIAPEACDVHDPSAWENTIHFTAPEREALHALLGIGLVDAFRLFPQPEGSYTWWDYRMYAFRRKMGLRIDLILLSPELARACTACTIDVEPRRGERPSDHAPVIAELALSRP